MANVTVRFFDRGNKPNLIQLPSNKKELSESMYSNSFEENDFDIYHISVMGVEFDNLTNDKDMKGFNLLAEKLSVLQRDKLYDFVGVLNSENAFITEKLKKVDALELCKILDNIDCYKLHRSMNDLTKEQLMDCEKIGSFGFLEKIGEYKNIDNSEIYSKYEIPDYETLSKLTISEIIGENNYSKEVSLDFPLRNVIKQDLDYVKNLDENKQYKVIYDCHSELQLHMEYQVTKQDLLELDKFVNKFGKLDEDMQNNFSVVYDMYSEVYNKEFENGIPINKFDRILKDTNKFEFIEHEEMKELLINSYLTEKGVKRELREFINSDRLYEEVIKETDFYKDNINDRNYIKFVDKNVYNEYLKAEYQLLLEEKNKLSIQNERELLVQEENSFEMKM